MDVTSQPAIDESPDISPVALNRQTASVVDRLARIESVLNIS